MILRTENYNQAIYEAKLIVLFVNEQEMSVMNYANWVTNTSFSQDQFGITSFDIVPTIYHGTIGFHMCVFGIFTFKFGGGTTQQVRTFSFKTNSTPVS